MTAPANFLNAMYLLILWNLFIAILHDYSTNSHEIFREIIQIVLKRIIRLIRKFLNEHWLLNISFL